MDKYSVPQPPALRRAYSVPYATQPQAPLNNGSLSQSSLSVQIRPLQPQLGPELPAPAPSQSDSGTRLFPCYSDFVPVHARTRARASSSVTSTSGPEDAARQRQSLNATIGSDEGQHAQKYAQLSQTYATHDHVKPAVSPIANYGDPVLETGIPGLVTPPWTPTTTTTTTKTPFVPPRFRPIPSGNTNPTVTRTQSLGQPSASHTSRSRPVTRPTFTRAQTISNDTRVHHPVTNTAATYAYPLTPDQVQTIANLHQGRIPSVHQLAPPSSHESNRTCHPPIINTGNSGPMQVQQGDWTCATCSFVNWRRRQICLRCFPFAHADMNQSLAASSEKAASLALEAVHFEESGRHTTALTTSPMVPAGSATNATTKMATLPTTQPVRLSPHHSIITTSSYHPFIGTQQLPCSAAGNPDGTDSQRHASPAQSSNSLPSTTPMMELPVPVPRSNDHTGVFAYQDLALSPVGYFSHRGL